MMRRTTYTSKRIIKMLFGILTILLLSTQEIWGHTYSIDLYAQNYAGGSGTKNDPYLISNDMELAKLARDVNNGNTSQAFLGKYFKLTADIDLKNGIWMPIGKYYNYGNGNGNNRLFFGKFDGNGHVIKNMHIQWEGTDAWSAWGLFSTLQGASSTNLTTVTNLIIENALVEKKQGFKPYGPGYNVGVVAGEIYGNTELSNIIIRGSVITDNDETYEINNESKIGGISGNVQTDSKNETFRIFNIAADTQINMLKNTSVFNNKFCIAQGFGRFSYNMKGGDNIIEPTNIYLFGKGLNVESSNSETNKNINKGGITANCQNENNAKKYASTWYYTQNVDGGKNLGTQKTDAAFKGEFAKIANEFITKNNLTEEKTAWYFNNNNISMNNNLDVYVVENYNRNDYNVSFSIEGISPETDYTYTWKVDNKEITPAKGGKSISLELSNKKRVGVVTITDSKTQEVIMTKNFVINPKYYSIDLYADNYAQGSGSETDPYIISNDLELAKLAYDVNKGTATAGKYFKLSNDINLDKALWIPIGSTNYEEKYFNGKFDGDGYSIDNMRILWTDTNNGWSTWGLFSAIKGTADNEANFCRITNLVMDHALIEKEPNTNQTEKSGNVAVLVGEVLTTGYSEVSNIIVRNSVITDNNESYKRKQFRVGGIIGNLEDNHITRLFNLSAQVEIKMLSNATLRDKCYMAEGIGRYGAPKTSSSYAIPLTNIYVHGSIETTINSNNCYVGGVIGNNANNNNITSTSSTWYYTEAVSVTTSNVVNYGTKQPLSDFANIFAENCNSYIAEKNIDGKSVWTYINSIGFKFSFTRLAVKRGFNAEITAETVKGNAANEKYFWYTSADKKIWELQNKDTASNPFTLPRKDYDQYVYAELADGSSRSGIIKIEAVRVEAKLISNSGENTISVSVTNNIWNNNDYLNITYSWVKNDDEERPVSTTSTYDKSKLDKNDKLKCHVVVKSQDGIVLLDNWLVYVKSVIYICPAGVNVGSKTYNAGNDDNDGLTPETAVKTWNGAYSKLAKEGTWDDNIIVLMGMSDYNVTNNSSNGFTSVTFDSSSEWEKQKSTSPFFKNATITGSWNDVDYHGVMQMKGGGKRDESLPIYGDTRFQHLTFKRNEYVSDKYDILYCQFYNLEMGEGIQMINYKDMFDADGTIYGAKSTSFQIFGGFNDDARFRNLWEGDNLKKMDESLPHGHEGFSIKIKSGHYSTICVGGRQTKSNINGLMGSPNMPIKCTIDVDIDRNFNDNHNDNQSTLDVAVVLAGNHEGAMVGDVDIIIKSGKIGRVVNGSLGAKRNVNGYNNAPYNTFMGRANILIDPAQSENNKQAKDINSRVEITEIYGGSTGRGFVDNEEVENPFYGQSTITIKGGTFLIPIGCNQDMIFSGIYGAGAGGMNGIGDDDNHTPDTRIPYWNDVNTKSVINFGGYATAKDKLCLYHCYNSSTRTFTDIDPRETSTNIIIEGGIFGSSTKPIDGIYAGGSGYMSLDLWPHGGIPSKVGGNIYGKAGETVASITINGGEFYCKNGIFAGGRGTDYYYAKKDNNKIYGTPSDYTDLGKIYGNVELTINGGIFHCPVFGGGYGVADAKLLNSNKINTLNNMARLYGSSTVKINGGTFFENIYGGGDMAVVGKETNVIISDSADIRADVFAGGNGRTKRADTDYDIKDNTWKPELVGKVVGNTNLTFFGSTKVAPYIYGDIYGGGNLAQVEGDTHINMYAANFAGEIFGGGKGRITDDKGYAIADEGLYTYANVTGNTFVSLAKDQGVQINDKEKEEDNFSINVIWNRKLDSTKENFIEWNTNKAEFFANGKFLNPHNIYGGGNLACEVTGKATLNIQKGMTPFSLLKTTEWKVAYDDNNNPHFSVFGGGYGLNTTVGNTDVTVNVEGDYSVYDAEIEDDTEQLSKGQTPLRAKGEMNVFDNSKGIPNFTILAVLGGGYAGTVKNDTKVTIDGKTFIHRVYGGGFGDPESTSNNNTGKIGGNTEVYVKGGNIYGDVFGGGAGVKPKNDTYFTDVAKVEGTTKVEISDDAHVYGDVYGGGDMANIGSYITHTNKVEYYGNKPKSISTFDQTNGNFISYKATDYKSFVNIIGGNIFGKIFAGGKGLKKAEAPEYNKVGRINGNTILHIANTNEAGMERITPMVWNRVYGGCAYGVVDGNTLVHVEGGMLGLNIFGGGYGDIPITNDKTDDNSGQSTASSTLEQVLGKKDTKNEGTYACILGNTKVQIDGGAWLWDRKADKNGKITTWLDVQTDNEKVCENLDEFKDIIYAIHNANTLGEITNAKAKAAMSRIINNKDTKEFFEMTDGDFGSARFSKNHNIFGGGNRACYVGYGIDGNSTGDGTGEAIVEINHSPVTEIIGANGKSLDILDFTTLQGLCWYLAEKNSNNPQFSVFGAGYGANTKVRNAKVYAQTGAMIELNGTPNKIDGKSFRYASQEEDRLKYTKFETNLYIDYMAVSKEDKKLYYGSVDGTSDDADTFRRYYNTRMAWILGIPGFTFQEIHGGGFSGYVEDSTYVEANNQLACYNIYGGGLGALPYGTLNETTDKDNQYDFGSVGGNSKVFIKSGNVAKNVYGGGAGIESIRVSGDNIVSLDSKTGSIIDFPDMARVKGKTEVHVYGENVGVPPLVIDRTVIMGNVYGGGDVANVGLDSQKATAEKIDVAKSLTPSNFTSFVNVRGGTIFSKVFAGGKGRTADVCGDYTKLGGIYGNACVVTGRPVMTYPYNEFAKGSTTEYTSTSLDPSEQQYLVNPDATVNKDLMPNIMNSVYGGGQNGTIYGNTLVAIKDGALYYNVFGGGWGDEETNTSANITGNTNLSITGGQAMLTSYWSTTMRNWEPATIVGDKTYSPQYIPATQKFKVNHNIYGGGDKTCVVGERDKDGNLVENSGNTYIKLEKGLLHDNTQLLSGVSTTQFFSSNEWKEIFNKVGSPHFCVFGGGFGEKTFVLSDSHIEVAMEARGSINKGNDIIKGEEYKHFFSDYSMMDIVGGGFSGQVNGTTHIYGAGGASCRRVFGGGFYSSVKATDINIKAIDCHDIFGGGFMGDVEKETKVVIGSQDSKTSTFGNDDIYIHGNVYGGNDVSGAINIVLDSNGYFKDNGGTGTNVNIYGGHIYGDVYGAGNGNYLYALDKKGNKKVTVNEYYPVNPNDSESETIPLVYTVPMRETMPSYMAASDAAKIVNINSWRPITNKVNIDIKGNSTSDIITIDGDVYGGGNSASVQKSDNQVGAIKINIGNNVNIRSVFMGCNGEALFAKSEDNDFMNKFQKLNGDVENGKELNLADTIDWINDPSNKGISTIYLSTENAQRPLVYPHLLDLYFQSVETDIQGQLTWNGTESGDGLTNCTIGTFCCGGNRGNMSVYPNSEGNVIDYTFPAGLVITNKIVGGCNNANYNYKDLVTHEGGYLLGNTHSEYPFIKLTIKNQFKPKEDNNAYIGGNVYGGCYQAGTVRGDIVIDFQSDMLGGKSKEKLDNSNDFLSSKPQYSALNVYGGGYGMESYVYGNTDIIVAKGLKCSAPSTSSSGEFNASGVSANFVYGGGQQGNVIGVTNVDVLNGHIYKAVTGGSYSGYVWGSTQVKVGYPIYYKVKDKQSGIYLLDRTDKSNKYIDHEGNTETGAILSDLASETIKQDIKLIAGDIISQAVYESIIGKQGLTAEFVKTDCFETCVSSPASPLTWDDINIQIGEAIYGGGYSVAQGTSVLANDSTVLKYTDKYNIDKAFTTENSRLVDLAELPNGTTKGFGGNTTILVADNSAPSSTRDHITISHQEMKSIVLPNGTDLFGYYYKDKNGNYRYISLQDHYFYGDGYDKPVGQSDTIYVYDSEGGIFGDGHQSYAEGFRSADLTGYGFAGTTINNPKIINTFQRMDILRLEDNCFNVLGARDYATNVTNKTPYSIARVGEIQMFAKNIALDGNKLQDKSVKRARNYMGLANNIHYVGAVTSNVPFNEASKEAWRDDSGKVPASGDYANKSYLEVKQSYIDQYKNDKDEATFQKRNEGTAKNMIGIASGYALKIQNVQELYDANKKIVDKIYYGPIYGVIEMNLIDVREDEGGGYVYADNVHKRDNGKTPDFLETTGNFVFPYDTMQNRYIVDDCFPTGFDGLKTNDPDSEIDVHYWYVTGFNYYYNAHITGFTYKDAMKFNNDNRDGLTVLAGLKPNQPVTIHSWKMRSGHPTDTNEYSCDLEYRNYLPDKTEGNVDIDNKNVAGGYTLRVGGSSSYTYSNPEASDTEDANKGFAAVLPMNATGAFDSNNYIRQALPSELNNGDAKISFELSDNVNNTTTEYFNKHLSKKCLATLILKAPAYSVYNSETDNKPIISKVATSTFFTLSATGNYEKVENNTNLSEGKDYYIKNGIEGEYAKVNTTTKIFKKNADGYAPVNIKDVIAGDNYFCEVPRVYTYTIYLTIEYVQGPNINGNITVDNCALPGEMIRLKKNNVTIAADQAFSANGYYWRIGKRKKNADGKWEFEDKTEWNTTNKATGYDTYKQGDAKTAEGLFKNCKYDKTNDYLDIPAYYFMNGYGVQLGITMNGLDKIFTVDMDNDNEFLIHNYHRMNPHKEGLDLHLAEAIKRAKKEKDAATGTTTVPFAEPRIYISDLSDLTAFINFIDTIGADGKVPRYGANAQFVLQKDLTVPSDFVCGTGIFQGIFHGNGHVIHGLPQDKSLLAENQGQIYNLGLESGNIAAKGSTNGGAYHCCFEQNPSSSPSSSEASSSLSDGVSTPFAPIVYRMDGSADTHYTSDDFKYGRVAYDLNEYYLRARFSNDGNNPDDMKALKYVYDYYANGDYQYANRTDAITGKNTGITFLRTGLDSDLPNYEQAETRHNQAHDIDKARVKVASSSASSSTPSSFDDVSTPFAYEPLFDDNHAATTLAASNIMNDFIFWGQKLQATPESCPQAIESHQNCYMTNRVYRTAGYYGDTKLDAFHYNAYNYLGGIMTTYVHQPSITAIDFTCKGDISKSTGKNNGIFYPPVDDNAKVFSDFSVKDDVTKNLLVYTNNNVDINSDTEAYDLVNKNLSYNESTRESLIKGHHVFTNTEGFTTAFLHLVERTADNKNSEGGICENNNFCAPLPFTVTNRAWYVRKPQQYANDNTGAWEGICLPFTIHKVVASINGEITHFYGTPTADELSTPSRNTHTLHHEYWLRGLTTVDKNGTDIAATFQRPGLTSDGLFMPIAESSGSPSAGFGSTSAGSGSPSLSEGVSYTFATPFFIDTYESRLYNKDANPYYATPHTYSNYPLLTSEVPYIVRFPGEGYYEFDLSSKFYNDILGKSEPEQTVAFNAYGYENMETSYGSITIPVTKQMATTKDGYTHCGTFAAKDIKKDAIYSMNDKGNAFISEASTATSVMPFRTYMTAKTTKAKAMSYAPYMIKIAESTGIDKIIPEIGVADKDEATGSYLIVRPLTNNKVRIESNISTTIYVYTITGQLYRILDVIPGNSVYSGFQQGAYIFGKTKIMVQ